MEIQSLAVITKIEKQNKKQQRYNIFVDDEFVCAIHEDILIKYKLFKDKYVNQTFIDEVIAAEDHHQVYLDAIKILTNRSNSSKELEHKMRRKGYEMQTIQSVIQTLIQQNYINDTKFAREWVLQQINNHQGVNKIRYNLKQKGFKNDEVLQAVQLYTKDMEFATAIRTAEKKIKTLTGTPVQQKNKLITFLQRRGFTTEAIKSVLNTIHISENELDDDFINDSEY
jgi:regulatory protein